MRKNLTALALIGLAITSSVVSIHTDQPQKCYAIAFADGPDLGPYQAGVIAGIVESLPSDQIAYQTVSGISLGALNANIFSQFELGQEKEASKKLEKFWRELSASDLYKNWHGGYLKSVLFDQSLYNNQGLKDFIAKWFENTDIKRHINIGIANVLNGTFTTFSEKTSN